MAWGNWSGETGGGYTWGREKLDDLYSGIGRLVGGWWAKPPLGERRKLVTARRRRVETS